MNDHFEESNPVPERRMRTAFGCLFVAVTFIIGSTILILVFAFGSLRNSEPAQLALAEVQDDPAVTAALGQPIELGLIVSGSISRTNDEGKASLQIPISGSRQSGTIYAQAEKVSGENWFFERLVVETDEGERIILRE